MSDLLFSVENNIARITLNRADNLNAFSLEMIQQWIKALETVRDSDDIRAVIVKGNGRGFCAGGDIKAMSSGNGLVHNDGPEDLVSTGLARKNSLWKYIQRVPLLLQEIDKPVIAQLHGFAIGAGFDMALACDIRIAGEGTKISESYMKAGIVPGDGAAYFLPRIVGVDKALEMLWTGGVFTAKEAKEMGLVTHVVPDEELDAFVEDYVKKLTEGPQQVMRFMKRAVYQGLETNLRTSLDMISSAMGLVMEHEDYQEGVNALKEKRKPKFQ